VHTLFDRGYVTVTPDRRFRVSRRLRDDFHNGEYSSRSTGARSGCPLARPTGRTPRHSSGTRTPCSEHEAPGRVGAACYGPTSLWEGDVTCRA
jgi:hypothetical protein